MKGSKRSSISNLLQRAAAGISDPTDGMQRDGILFETHGIPLIEQLDKLSYSTEPIEQKPERKRNKKLGRTTEGYNPLGISPEAE